MIKKILSLTFILSISSLILAQNCTPDQNINTHGYYPALLDSAQEMSMYSMTMQIYSKRDTMVDNPFGAGQVSATIDSIIVDSVIGLPPGISFICNPANCRLVSLKTHCINIFGTPQQKSAGTYPLTINVTVKATISGAFPYSTTEEVRDFSIIVKDDNISSIAKLSNNKKLKVYPNPSSNKISIENLQNKSGDVLIFGADGKSIDKLYIQANSTLNIINTSWKPGVYTIQVIYSDGSIDQMSMIKI